MPVIMTFLSFIMFIFFSINGLIDLGVVGGEVCVRAEEKGVREGDNLLATVGSIRGRHNHCMGMFV